MKKIIIEKNDANQRLDRFLKKYLNKAPKGFIYKMIRKKNITLNGKKTDISAEIVEGDSVELYLSDETLSKFRIDTPKKRQRGRINIVYEGCGILILNKPEGLLSHGTGREYEDNLLDRAINYLIEEGKYIPRVEKSFTPALSNRLDRNTSGLVIVCYTHEALTEMNKALREGNVIKKYMTIVTGKFRQEKVVRSFLKKDEEKNMVYLTEDEGKEIITKFIPVRHKDSFTELEVVLYTGRTHQIRSQLKALRFPIIGDEKYGDSEMNKNFDLKGQFLHCKELKFNDFEGELEGLSGMEFKAPLSPYRARIYEKIFKEE